MTACSTWMRQLIVLGISRLQQILVCVFSLLQSKSIDASVLEYHVTQRARMFAVASDVMIFCQSSAVCEMASRNPCRRSRPSSQQESRDFLVGLTHPQHSTCLNYRSPDKSFLPTRV